MGEFRLDLDCSISTAVTNLNCSKKEEKKKKKKSRILYEGIFKEWQREVEF